MLPNIFQLKLVSEFLEAISCALLDAANAGYRE